MRADGGFRGGNAEERAEFEMAIFLSPMRLYFPISQLAYQFLFHQNPGHVS
jgi:hypothetical protein